MKVQYPNGCRSCPAYREEEEDEFWGLCATCSFVLSTNGDTKHEVIDGIDTNTMRMPWCPLPPPSHGRLIDADALTDDLEFDVNNDQRILDELKKDSPDEFTDIKIATTQDDKDIKQNCIQLIKETKAIIEASE